jgi:hypothetical protein
MAATTTLSNSGKTDASEKDSKTDVVDDDSHGYLAYDGHPPTRTVGNVYADQVGTLSFEMFMQTQVSDLTRGAPTKEYHSPDRVADAFNCAISKRQERLLNEYKITADQYALLPYQVRYYARYYMAKGKGRDDVKADANTVRAQARMLGIKNLNAPVNVLRKHIASYIHKIGLLAPIAIGSENFDEWMKIEVLTGRTCVLIGLAPIEDTVAYLSKCAGGEETGSAAAAAASAVPEAVTGVETRNKRKAKTIAAAASKRKVKKLKTVTFSVGN